MSLFTVRPGAAFIAVLGSLAFASSAQAATLAVDDDGVDCPAAPFTSIQAAIDAAAPGDTITVCAGDYVEGTGAVGTNALTIGKSLTLKGSGADLVSISPRATTPTGGQILETTPDLRNGVGDVVSVVGTPTQPITVNISGVTVDGYDPAGRAIAVEAGVVYLDAKGSIRRSRVTNTVTSEGDNASTVPGGYRGPQPGIGIAQVSAALVAPVDGTRDLDIELTRVDKYNRIGVLIDGSQGDALPVVPSGTINRGRLVANQIVGRTQCINFSGTGDCSIVGPITTGPLFGQDGLRVTAGARALVSDSLISQNVVNGTGAPLRASATNNANLPLGAGIRLIGAQMTTNPVSNGLPRTYNTSVVRSNVTDNAYGAINVAADGTTPNSGNNVFLAENNWWGLRILGGTNSGPAISPVTNPPFPENPVNGTATTDPSDGVSPTSTAVDFFPYRAGIQSDPDDGEFQILQAPLPVDDAAPTGVTITAGSPTVAPSGGVDLSVAAADDFGVKRVRIYDGATVVADLAKPPYTARVVYPADAACGSTHTYTALVGDSIDQTTGSLSASNVSTGKSATVTVACTPPPTDSGGPGGGTGTIPNGSATPAPAPPPAPVPAPTPSSALSIGFAGAKPSTVSGTRTLRLTVSAPAGVRAVRVRLGGRLVCSFSAAPFVCKVTPTGKDVGRQALVAAVTDLAGSTAVTSTEVTVPKFLAKLSIAVKKTKLKGGRYKRTIKGTVRVPRGVTRDQGCRSSKVALTVKVGQRKFLDQQVAVTKNCTFTRSVTTRRAKQKFALTARFRGSSTLSTIKTSRRFS